MGALIGIEWLAAAVAPWAVAPHPNFSVEVVSPPAVLALTADYRIDEIEHYQGLIDDSENLDAKLLDPALRSIQAGEQERAIEDLRRYIGLMDRSPGARAAATLFASVALSELDRPWHAVELLSNYIETFEAENVGAWDHGSAAILEAAIRLQRSIRLLESGKHDLVAVDTLRVAGLLENLRAAEFEQFPTSEGISWDSTQVQNDIADVFSRRATAIRASLDIWRDKSWVEIIRSRPAWLDVRAERRAAVGLERLASEQFEATFRSSSRTVRLSTGNSIDPVFGPLAASLFNAEISADFGDLGSRRSDLARLQMLRVASQENSHHTCVDALRLFRGSNDPKTLRRALEWIRVKGPNSALKASAQAILAKWLVHPAVNRLDLAVLSASAELLSLEERQTAIACALTYQSQDVEPGIARFHMAKWARVEEAWRALASLVTNSEMDQEIAEAGWHILDSSDFIDILIRPVVRVAAIIKWDEVSDSTKARWLAWANANESGDLAVQAQIILGQLGRSSSLATQSPKKRAGIALARQVLRDAEQGLQPQPEVLVEAIEVCRNALTAICDGAESLRFGIGREPVGDIAVAIASRFNVDDALWECLARLLTHPQVTTYDKAPILKRLATEPARNVDRNFIERLRSDWELVRNTQPGELAVSDLSEFRSALLRAGYHLSVLTLETFIAEVTRMATEGPIAKTEAVGLIVLADLPSYVWEWGCTIIMQLCGDTDGGVAVSASYGLARYLGKYGSLSTAALHQLDYLLRSDGVKITPAVLRGLQDASPDSLKRIPSELRQTIDTVASSHQSIAVRSEAKKLLDLIASES